HGGYGVTAAVPVVRPAERDEPVAVAAAVPAPAYAATAAEAPMTRPHAPTSSPTGPVSVPTNQQPAHQQQEPQQPAAYPAPVQFATAPVPPAPAAEDLPEHLNFTANLDLSGLRDGSERDGDQNVGPTK
ncbi:MAG: cell division ATP-binding protein FtsE, partial [Leifsonia sp.]|nr:cell division ATP-binding protein FtsE [Leifsonia sp.]